MKLLEVRQMQLISVVELADKAGVSHTTIRRIENGVKTHRMDVVRRVSQALGVPAAMIDEFQHLAGTPEQFTARLAAREGQKILDAIDRSDREGWLEEHQLTRRAQGEPVPA